MQLSPHFTVSDLSRSQTASRFGIDNTPDAATSERLRVLCVNVMEPILAKFPRLQVTSGYRGPTLNKRIGGAKDSQHMTGEAADVVVSGTSNIDLFRWIKANIKFDQLILEFDDPKTNGGWVHVSFVASNKNRNQALEAVRSADGRTVYRPLSG